MRYGGVGMDQPLEQEETDEKTCSGKEITARPQQPDGDRNANTKKI